MHLFSLPNILTLLNLWSGCMGLYFVFSFRLEWTVYSVIFSLLADFFDGLAARFTKTNSELGKQLDSLADVVSFGVLPGAVLFSLLYQYHERSSRYSEIELLMLSLPGFAVTLFAALRLAKFNIDLRQSEGFIGLATPAATLVVIGYLLVFLHNTCGLAEFFFRPYMLYGLVAILCGLMIAELPMFSFKFKAFGWKGNEVRYVFIILSVLLTVTLTFASVLAIMVLYILISIIQKLRTP